MTPQWRQLTAVQLLEELLKYSPPLSWTIDPVPDGPPLLEGRPYDICAPDAERRDLLVAWSRILEVPVLEVKCDTHTELSVCTSLGAVRVEIFTHADLTVPALDGAL